MDRAPLNLVPPSQLNRQELPLIAAPAAQLQLLDVARLDARIAQLRHQLTSLPEIAELAALAQETKPRVDRVRDAKIRVDDLSKEQRKADADVEQVKARRDRDRARIDAGQVTDPKALQALSHELESLARRISTLEDEELEVMEMLEAAQMELAQAEADVAECDERREILEARRLEKAAAIERELAAASTDRDASVVGLPEDLFGLYERIRGQRGVGAAELRARECGGCRLQLNAADLAVIAKTPDDQVVRCEECTTIMVRTAESGL